MAFSLNGNSIPGTVEELSPQTAESRYQKQAMAGVPGATVTNLGRKEKRIDAQIWLSGYSTSALCQAARLSIEALIMVTRGPLVLNNGFRNETYTNVVLESVYPIGQRDPIKDPQTAIQWNQRIGLHFIKLN